MRVGIGLPSAVPAADEGRGGGQPPVLDYARRAEEGPFTSLGVVDRVVYDSYDPLLALAAAAAVTARVRLVTMIVIGPIRSAGLLAKQAASLDSLSGGRVTLGLSIGARREDYEATGTAWAGRGRRLSAHLAAIRDAWEDAAAGKPGAVGPPAAQEWGPQLLVGGLSGASFLRAARYADGYVHGGGPPRAFASAASKARAAWVDAGRPGAPDLWGQSYFTLTDPDAGRDYLRDYYAFTGAFAERIAAGLLTSPKQIRDHLRGYADAGCDELVLLPATSDPTEVDRLADVIG